MPLTPEFHWEQSADKIIVTVSVKRVKVSAIDVFISDCYVKINAENYLLHLDLFHPTVVPESTFRIQEKASAASATGEASAGADGITTGSLSGDPGPFVILSLSKAETGLVWPALCIEKATPKSERNERRKEALRRAESHYQMKLDSREKMKEVEKKRNFNEQWQIEKDVRAEIRAKMIAEKESEAKGLEDWTRQLEKSSEEQRKNFKNPGDIFCSLPAVRETTNVPISFTPKALTAPTRARGDEDYYRKSRYKPVSLQDSPMYWKERGDDLYKKRDWKGAVDAYSESIKRDGIFLTCVANRAACFIHLHEYGRAIEDCDLAITLLSNTPASDTTQDNYKRILIKLHVRRGAALAWKGDVSQALENYRVALAYQSAGTTPDPNDEVVADVRALESYMAEHGLLEHSDPVARKRSEANHLYHSGQYGKAIEIYQSLLQDNEFDVKSQSNLTAALLQTGDFKGSLSESQKLLAFLSEVANAINEPGAQSANLLDSDDEEEGDDEYSRRKLDAARTIRDKSGHVYLLLKCYVRMGCAHCGLKDYRSAFECYEQALKITPYDDDLREDANRILEKLRMNTLVGATTGAIAKKEENKA